MSEIFLLYYLLFPLTTLVYECLERSQVFIKDANNFEFKYIQACLSRISYVFLRHYLSACDIDPIQSLIDLISSLPFSTKSSSKELNPTSDRASLISLHGR